MRINLLLLLFCITSVNFATAQHISVLTQHNNNTRSGYNDKETILTTKNVNPKQFGKAFSLKVDDQLYAQPLVMADLPINGGTHNVVYLATVNNTIYAYDGDNGALYWQKNYTPQGQRAPMNSDMTGACGGQYLDFSGNMGIVGTPVIDSVAQTLYFVARSTPSGGNFFQYLHAVSLVDGSERTGSPVQIAATLPGTGDGSTGGNVSFDPQKNNQRQALTLLNGIVYVTFSSHCDWTPYHGWILGYDEQTLQQKIVYVDTPNGVDGGLWESGMGPAADSQGNLLIVTGNGTVGQNHDPNNLTNRGESAMKLTPTGSTLAVSSFFTPANYQNLEDFDLDYGVMGAFLIPNSNYFFTGCKDGNLYLLDKDNMGGFSSTGGNQHQTINLGQAMTLHTQPAYFKGTSKEFIYLWSENDIFRAIPFNRAAGLLDVNNQLTGPNGPGGESGAVISVTSNGGANGTGIVWVSYASNGDANQSVRPGVLRAFDANNINTQMWDNNENPTRDASGNFAKFSSPTIANGHVYLPTFSNQVVVYGLIDTGGKVCSSVNLAFNKPAFASSNENNSFTAAYAFDGNPTTRWSSAYSDPQWIYVDLGQIDSICRVTLTWETALGKNFQIQVSGDAQNWTTVATITNNTSNLNFIDVTAKGRFVRLYGTARGTQYGYSLYEFAVNGKVLTPPQSTLPGAYNIDNFVVYPNPTKGQFSFTFNSSIAQNIKWTLTDANGRTLQKQSLTNFNGPFETDVDASHYPAGEYIIAVHTSKGIISRKLIKL